MTAGLRRILSLAAMGAVLAAMAGCGGSSGGGGIPTNLLYVQTNNPNTGQNAVIAYTRNPNTGALAELGTYSTGGTGFFSSAALGPDDHDQEMVATSNKEFMFVANQGSNSGPGGDGSISSFRINANGTLTLTRSQPVDSGGVQPVALVIVGDHLYVANRGDVSGTAGMGTGTVAGNYTGFTIGSDGSLTPIPNSTITLSVDASPSQLAVTLNGNTLFGNEFNFATTVGQIDGISINSDGSLTPIGSMSLPNTFNPQLTLGLMTHPTEKILYTGIPVQGEVGTWTYGSGTFAFSSAEQTSTVPTEAALCWIAIDPAAKFLYTSSVGPDIVGVLSIDQTDATKVTRIQNYTIPGSDTGISSPFNLTVDPSGKFLYTLNDLNDGTGGAIHVMTIAADGTVSGGNNPTNIAASATNFHPSGMVIF